MLANPPLNWTTSLTNTTLFRVQPLLLTVFGVSACQNLFFLLLPLQLKAGGHETGPIGWAMSFYAFGAIFAGLFGAKAIAYVGHIRTFALMSAIMVSVSALHSFYGSILLTGLLRAIAGFALITNFITLESWLNVITDKSNRARIFSIYQICVGIGGMSAPFVLNSFELNDPRLFTLVAIFLSVSIIIMSVTRLPAPSISETTSPMGFNTLWNYSPSGTLACFCAGLMTSVSISLVAIYATDRAFTGWVLSMVLSSLVVGGLAFQYPVGWFADRFDKRSVASAVMAIGAVANGVIILETQIDLPITTLIIAFLISGGSAAALFPLAVTQVFDQIDAKDAVRATGTLQITLGLGGFLGPVLGGNMMDYFGSVSLFYFIGLVHFVVIGFLVMRKVFASNAQLPSSTPYQVTAEPQSLLRTGIDPKAEYSIADIGDSNIKILMTALGQNPNDPKFLIQTTLESARLEPMDIAVHLVLAHPKHSDALIGMLVSLYPEKRMDIAQSLYELIILGKRRINALVKEGLCLNASDDERDKIHAMIQEALDSLPESTAS